MCRQRPGCGHPLGRTSVHRLQGHSADGWAHEHWLMLLARGCSSSAADVSISTTCARYLFIVIPRLTRRHPGAEGQVPSRRRLRSQDRCLRAHRALNGSCHRRTHGDWLAIPAPPPRVASLCASTTECGTALLAPHRPNKSHGCHHLQGSDANAVRTRAIQQADGSWELTGQKQWISNGGQAEVFTVFAQVCGRLLTGGFE